MSDEQLQLIPDNSNAIVPMAKSERDGITGTLAINADRQVLRNTIKAAILKAYFAHKRQKDLDTDELTYMIEEITGEILRAYGSIRLEEIGLAIHKSAMGEFEKVYSLSVAFFVGGIRAYMNSEKRTSELKLMLAKNETSQLPEHTISPEEIAENKKQIVLNAFEFYKNKGFFNDHGNYVFKSLADYGVINFTEEDKIRLFKQAKTNVIHNLTKMTTSIDRRNENRKLLAEIKENADHYLIWIEDMKLALLEFFKTLIEFDKDLKELIEA